jgi:hypothetical protein
VWDLCWTEWQWLRFLSALFDFPLRQLSSLQCSIVYLLLCSKAICGRSTKRQLQSIPRTEGKWFSVCMSICCSDVKCGIIFISIIIINDFVINCWPLPLFLQYLDPINIGRTPWTGGSTRSEAATYTQDNTNTLITHKHPCLEWDSKPRSQRSSVRRQFMP